MKEIILLAGWVVLWVVGGCWIVQSSFTLRKNETTLAGLTAGLFIETVVANMLTRFIEPPLSFWLAAILVFLAGAVLVIVKDWHGLFRVQIQPGQWIAFVLLFGIFFAISRGLSIFDDYAHLPTTSMLATGDVPPHFALDPEVPYSYHYFLMLFAAQVMRIGDVFVWTALDISRSLAFGLTVMMAVIWGQRITFSHLGGVVNGIFRMFSGGARWLLLLLPAAVIAWISPQISMLGSAAQSAPDFQTALSGYWQVDGAGPIPFQFAFANGIINPGVLGHGPNGIVGGALTLFLLLTFNRWKGWKGAAVTVFLLAAMQLLGEVGIVLSVVSWGLLTVFYMVTHRTWRLPTSLWHWWVVLIAGWGFGLLQGGALGGALQETLAEGILGAETGSYQTLGFQFVWPPAIVSSHLGVLSMTNPAQLITALCEIGPLLLVFPLVVIWGIKSYRAKRWYEASLILSACISLVLVFFQFSGSTGVRNSSRFYSFLGICSLWVVPIVWRWFSKRRQWVKTSITILSLVSLVSGVVIFGVELAAIQKPVMSTLVNNLDARMSKQFWNKLEPGTMVFDPLVYRAPTIFARPNASSLTWYERKPGYLSLYEEADPHRINEAGYAYVYFDEDYWEQIGNKGQQRFSDSCVKVLAEYTQPDPRDLTQTEMRRLLDIRQCK
jgi:hypothetical protein